MDRLTKTKIDVERFSEKTKSRLSKNYLDMAKLNNKLFEYENFMENFDFDNLEELENYVQEIHNHYEEVKNKGTCGLCHYIDNEQIEMLKKEVANLEAKLAEKEKEIEESDDEWREICDGKLETINRLIEEKHELQRQLEDKEKHIIGQNALLNKSKENNKQLKQQLKKKEFAINNYWQSEKNKKEMFREENKKLKQQLAENAKYKEWVLEFLEKHNINTDSTPEYSENPIIEYFEQIKDFRECDNKEIEMLLSAKQASEEQILDIVSNTAYQHNPIQLEIAQLKQQLAEKDAEVQSWKDGTMVVKLGKLEEQLAEKDEAIEGLQEINQSLGQTCNNDAKEIERLREQLAEKEKEIKELKKEIRDELVDNNMAILELQQSQNQTAIAELKKLKHDIIYYDTDTDFNNDVVAEFSHIVFKLIDQQITKLKGEK